MSVLWAICGCGRGVGKTHLAQALARVLPGAVYAKCGRGRSKAGKCANFFTNQRDLEAFIEQQAHRGHVVVESGAMVRAGADISIYIDGSPAKADLREDADHLRAASDIILGPGASPSQWRQVLDRKLPDAKLRRAVWEILAEHNRYICEAAAGSGPSEPKHDDAAKTVQTVRISTSHGRRQPQADEVAVERAVTITIDQVGSFTVLCTPREVDALAVGFAFTEGIIDSIDDVEAMTDFSAATGQIAMSISDPSRAGSRRNLIVTSSCGMCGSTNIERFLSGKNACGDSMQIPAAVLNSVAGRMRTRQKLFEATGAAHAAAVFTADGRIVALAEDIGRHNAVDKAIGKCLLDRITTTGRGAVLSGRASFELVAKAARAGLEVLAAVSAPSSLAIEAAKKCNITLCAFVRPGRATVYTHPRRINGAAEKAEKRAT
ncbi:MAG: formate dehydrogenase accessory sulfurtransferase FdhD [Phycisphaerae bacterium]|nr:formate dehydrogenase accessory sulfurtransferase FdhD [Phycisphaerae bacterium]